ncbi:cysteine-rich receptor-like protein kinase 10 [Herrania umbratica]|uniref:Cysteine-rich receptor-like protein kinase 10 n=1 Tax=Herrania umbratica TaxID=108875 RepID=A0A6J1B472_9ROSI|nr:cysteine-rich receptor-like protein kinase 10 [Herrania umbratica]
MGMGFSRLLPFFNLVLLFLATLTLGAYPYFQSRCVDSAGNYTANSTYEANLDSIFSQVTSLTEFNYGFYNLSAGENPNKVNAIALCRGDRTQDVCNSCLNDTVSELRQRCPLAKEVVGWSEFCMLRYANRDILGEMEISPGSCLLYAVNVKNPNQFNQALSDLLNNLSSRAAAAGPLRKYAADISKVGPFQTIYALVQCTPDLSEEECGQCLNVAKDEIGSCCLGTMGCRVLRPSCFLRYESNPFFQTPVPLPSPPPSPTSSPPPSTGEKGNNSIRTVINFVASVVGIVILIIISICIFLRARKTRKKVENQVKRVHLDWKMRYRIIGGIARGLLYLHEDSRLRIIHRDLKASNVLLDAEMIPKIADFGMARLFVQDETHGNTSKIVGTYGYMAPEYAMHGQFSIKSDVFSFGVIILEIVSGQKNNYFRNEKSVKDLLSYVWTNWREGTALNLIDPTLRDGSRNEILRCIHIGLLCVQENVANRPTMATVVLMLNSFSISLPMPSQPAYFMDSNIDSDMSSSRGFNSRVSESEQSKSESIPQSQNEVKFFKGERYTTEMRASGLLLFFYPALLFLAIFTLAADPYFQSRCVNSAGNYAANSTYQANLNSIFSQVTSLTEFNYGFYNLSAGQNPNNVNAIALCRGDRNQDDCNSCLNDTVSELRQRCPLYKEVVGWSEYCMLRYANRDILGEMEYFPEACLYNTQDVTNADQFNQALDNLLNKLSSRAAAAGPLRKYAADNSTVGVLQTVYAMVQCTPDLSEQECGECLSVAKNGIGSCCLGKRGCRVLRPSCFLRFESSPFYQTPVPLPSPPPSPTSPPPPSTGGKGNNTTWIIIIVVASVVGVVMLITSVCIFLGARKNWEKIETVAEIIWVESLQFDFATVRVATSNFADANKLGQGGFGAVYKGLLSNGQEIAVKRLSTDSKQGEVEFKNEVLLMAKLHHRNLVRLLGFCLEGRERLLIYEFVPNTSLDHFIFDQVKRIQLNWERRYKIIEGIARGLLYLHEDSRLKIIHRDLKTSNVLLDADMTPKIADFGMAKLFAHDETRGNTSRVVGTYGYMAPEYIMHGQFSIKSDVFSFGVIILEIISGQKTNYFHNGESVKDLVSWAWKNWREGTALNLIDPTLRDGWRNEMLRCIHIGLLCVQENVADRPTMATVVLMLNSFSISLPLPLMHSDIESDMSSPSKYYSHVSESKQSKSETIPLLEERGFNY